MKNVVKKLLNFIEKREEKLKKIFECILLLDFVLLFFQFSMM
ncbi:hypothetical protein [Peribacillus frigoritolerans]|uniref:Uncharacterized protein n=1 Tax=Peribacillus castrilensis TaxID=2897690 RepID=A0AAW9NKV9_9BACI|nr:hypothetical protein [Peribacillus castrilensis]